MPWKHTWTKKEKYFYKAFCPGRLQDFFLMGWQNKEEREIWIVDQKLSVQ